ncbi:hypothetical protein BgiMline_020254 [Biomphalaria glabrata]|nr:hypothetical protein BgiMline_017468 [Biomphalaria glabrata]
MEKQMQMSELTLVKLEQPSTWKISTSTSTTTTKLKLFKTIVKLILLYGAENWRTTITTKKKPDARQGH